mgnify:CR=1 FL=1
MNNIIEKCRDGEINEKNISILSCYYPLYKLLDQIPSLESFNSSNQSFNELIILQISEPLKEIDLSQNIKRLGSIDDKISKKVNKKYINSSARNISNRLKISKWKKKGILNYDGTELEANYKAALVMPDGKDGSPAYLVFSNYEKILKYYYQ